MTPIYNIVPATWDFIVGNAPKASEIELDTEN